MAAGSKANRKGRKRATGDSSEVRQQQDKGQEQTAGTSAPKKIVPTFGKATGKVSQKSPANKRRKTSEQETKAKEEKGIKNEHISETGKAEIDVAEATEDVTSKGCHNCKESATNIDEKDTTGPPDSQSPVSVAASNEEKNCPIDGSSSCYIEIEKIDAKTKVNEEGENFLQNTENGVGNVGSVDQKEEQMETQPDDLGITKPLTEKDEKHSIGQLDPPDEILCEDGQVHITSDTTTSTQSKTVEQESEKIDLVKAEDKTDSMSEDLEEEWRVENVVQDGKQHSQACSESKSDEDLEKIVNSDATTHQGTGKAIQEHDVTAVEISVQEKEEGLDLTGKDALKSVTLEKDLTDEEVSFKENTDVNVIPTDANAVKPGEESKPVISESGNKDPMGNEDGEENEEKVPEADVAGGKAASTANGEHVIGVLKDVVQICKQEVSSDWNELKMSRLYDDSCEKKITGDASNADTNADSKKNSAGSKDCYSEDFSLTDEPFMVEQLKEDPATDLKHTVNQDDDSKMDFNDAEMTNSQIFMLDDEITTSPPRKLQSEDFNDTEHSPPLKTLDDYASEGSVTMKGLIDELSSVTKMVVGVKRYMDSIKKPKQTKIYSMWK